MSDPKYGQYSTAAYQRQRRAQKVAMGLCISCPARAAEGKRSCEACLTKNSARERAIRVKRAANGRRGTSVRCTVCNEWGHTKKMCGTEPKTCECGRPYYRSDRWVTCCPRCAFMDGMGPVQIEIIDHLRGGVATIESIAAFLGCPLQTASKAVFRLVDAGRVKRVADTDYTLARWSE